jgi:hypothetical protein
MVFSIIDGLVGRIIGLGFAERRMFSAAPIFLCNFAGNCAAGANSGPS